MHAFGNVSETNHNVTRALWEQAAAAHARHQMPSRAFTDSSTQGKARHDAVHLESLEDSRLEHRGGTSAIQGISVSPSIQSKAGMEERT